jgi:pyochelin biosynthesis protein PchC
MMRTGTVRTRGDGVGTRWVRTLVPVAGAADRNGRLICFPHSGGLATAFRAWDGYASAGWVLDAVQYPGRAERTREQPLPEVAALADAVADELLAGHDGEELAFFGSSFGALVAYETARRLSANGVEPRAVFVSSCRAPDRAGGGSVHETSDEQLWELVVAEGGIPCELARDASAAAALLPGLRADITAHETYVPHPGPRLRCAIRAYYSPADHLATSEDVTAWESWTTGTFTICPRDGGHFHPWIRQDGLMDDVLAHLGVMRP